MKIKVVKNIKEISASGAAVGYPGPIGNKEELNEDGELAAATFGSANPWEADEPAEKSWRGQIERALQQGNRAVNPRPTLHEEEIDESMMGTLANPGFGYEFAQPDDNPGDWENEHVKARRFERTLNRAFYPEGDIEAMRAKLDEALDDTYITSDSTNQPTMVSDSSPVRDATPPSDFIRQDETMEGGIIGELEKHGIIIEDSKADYLGGGKFGKVYKCYDEDDGVEGAIKIIEGTTEDIDREIRNYKLVSDARSKDPLIEKHFPDVYDAWKADILGLGEHGFIYMELLEPVNPEAKKLLPDHSYFNAGRGQKDDKLSAELGQEISKRAEVFLKNRGSLYKDIENEIEEMVKYGNLSKELFYESLMMIGEPNMRKIDKIANPPGDRQEMEAAIEQEKSKRLNRAETYASFKNLNKSLAKIKFMIDDHKESPFVVLFLLEIFNALGNVATDRVINNSLYMSADMAINSLLERIQKRIRVSALTRGGYDMKAIGQVMRKSKKTDLEAAIESLMVHTKLLARDLHWNNFLSRPNGDLVIVDLGMFKTSKELRAMNAAKNIKENRFFKVKVLTNRRK